MPLLVNYFKLKTQKSGLIFMYAITWGQHVSDQDELVKRAIRKNLKEVLTSTFLKYIPWGNMLFTSTDAGPEHQFTASASGKQHTIQLKYVTTVDLNDLTDEARNLLP